MNSPESTPRVAVIGGGIAGLAAAWQLENPPQGHGPACAVTIFEAAATVGGHLRTDESDGFRVEQGPNGFLDSEPATLELARAAGLEPQLLRSRDAARRRFLLRRGKLHEIPTTPRLFLLSSLLSPAAKLRIAGELFIPPRRDLGLAATEPQTDETVWSFGARRLGRAFADTMLDPMVRGITGGDCRRVSLAAAFPRMVELEQKHGGLFRALFALRRQRRGHADGQTGAPTGVLTSFAAGVGALPQALVAGLRGAILTGRPVSALRREADGWHLTAAGASHGPFAAVIDAAPAPAAAGHQPDPDVRRLLAQIRYNPLLVIATAWRLQDIAHPLDGFGMLTCSRDRSPLFGVLWDSSIFDHRAPAGAVLLRAMAGDPVWLEREDRAILRSTCAELDRLYGLRGEPLRHWIYRYPQAIAEYEVGHLARLAALERALARTPGLFLTGSSYRGIAINHCLKDSGRVAGLVHDFLAAEGRSKE